MDLEKIQSSEGGVEKDSLEKQPDRAEVNFYMLVKERAFVRRALADLEPGRSKTAKRVAAIFGEELADLDRQAKSFKGIRASGLTGAKERLRKDKATAHLDEPALEKELGPSYAEIKELAQEQKALSEFAMRTLLLSNGVGEGAATERILHKISIEREMIKGELAAAEKEHPDTTRAHELLTYKKGLHSEGHIAATPSVGRYLNQIGERMVSGKPMFLHGPTGTGKTSLARYASEQFTGSKAEMVYCNPQTRESNIWGKTGIKPTESGAIQTVDIYGPLARAMADGRVVIFDEFTALPKEQMVFIKGIFNAKPGDTVNVVGNGSVTIEPGFQMIFTANLKSEKNPERQDLPPEIAREFEQNNLEVKYNPPDEAFDIMLARCMNADGSVNLSDYDLTITLPQFAKAIAEIQEAYTGSLSAKTAALTGSADASGKTPGLKKFVTTQGTVENILDAWKTGRRAGADRKSFAGFLDHRLTTALTFKEYPLSDRLLAAKIFASMGFLRTVTPRELDLPADIFSFAAASTIRGAGEVQKLISQSADVKRHSLTELARLDPFHKKQERADAAAQGFLDTPADSDRETFEGFDLEAQYNVQRALLDKLGLPETIEGQLRPTLDQIKAGFAENPEFFKKKIEQGFTKLIIVPFGLPLEQLRQTYGEQLKLHKAAGALFAEANPATAFDLNDGEPVWKWEGYGNEERIYFPTQFDATKHGGLTKDQTIAQRGAWHVLLVEEEVIPRAGAGKTLSGRQQLEAGLSPVDYLNKLASDPQYAGEEGLTPELWLMKALARLDEKNEVIDDYQGNGSLCYNLGVYFPGPASVSGAYWYRGSRRAYLGRDARAYVDAGYGASSAVRVKFET